MANMPNGKPGDHPLTDILIHKLEVVSPRADALVREIVELGGRDELEADFNLGQLDPRFPPHHPLDLQLMETQLTALRDRLLSDRRERG
jgi:hypothetical protein